MLRHKLFQGFLNRLSRTLALVYKIWVQVVLWKICIHLKVSICWSVVRNNKEENYLPAFGKCSVQVIVRPSATNGLSRSFVNTRLNGSVTKLEFMFFQVLQGQV